MFGKLLILVALGFTPTAYAEKLSDVQEGALYGAGGVILLQHIFGARSSTGYSGSYSSANESQGFPSRADPVQRAYEEGVRQRREAELRERAARAYDCGRWGKNCEGSF